MTEAPPSKSHAMTWSLSIAGAIILYVASSGPMTAFTPYVIDWGVNNPPWVHTLSAPLN